MRASDGGIHSERRMRQELLKIFGKFIRMRSFLKVQTQSEQDFLADKSDDKKSGIFNERNFAARFVQRVAAISNIKVISNIKENLW